MKALRIPLLFAVPAVLVALTPAARGSLAYNRDAIGHAELWRLWTGHWVHFSTSHLLWNLAVLLIAGAWLEHVRPGRLLHYTLLAAPLMSVTFLGLAPAMHTYGGLSGLATGVVVLLALEQLRQSPADRARWLAVLVLVAVKTGLDAAHPTPLFSDFGSGVIRSSALAHAAGAALALGFFLSRRTDACLPLSGTAPVCTAPDGKSPR